MIRQQGRFLLLLLLLLVSSPVKCRSGMLTARTSVGGKMRGPNSLGPDLIFAYLTRYGTRQALSDGLHRRGWRVGCGLRQKWPEFLPIIRENHRGSKRERGGNGKSVAIFCHRPRGEPSQKSPQGSSQSRLPPPETPHRSSRVAGTGWRARVGPRRQS